jgi:hypothetical protein
MKNALQFIAAFIFVFAAFFGYAYMSTKEVRVMSDTFVHHIGADEMDQAYAMLNKQFQQKVPFSVFSDQLRKNHFNTLVSVSWTSYSVKNGIQSAEGAITLKSGIQADIRIRVGKLDSDIAYSIISYAFSPSINEDQL